MTMDRITDESLNQLIAIESLASDNASNAKRMVDGIYHSNMVSALEELRDYRASAAIAASYKDAFTESVDIYCYHYNAEMKTSHRAGYIGSSEKVADRESYMRLMTLIGEANNDTVTGLVSLSYLGKTKEFLSEQCNCRAMARNGGAV